MRNYLKKLGYSQYRKIYKNKEWVLEPALTDDFSTMMPGRICILYIKDDREIYWGLSEHNKPPTLLYPRPNIEVVRKHPWGVVKETELWDDSMNMCLKKETSEDIYKAMYDDTVIFKYNLTDEKATT